ncbi:SdrD B-like domain-containing protein [Yoonia sp. GPGPB17]|uniref:DUF7507 domain-containing protein n=1 Tax=Yoonia sp. GPGPB17 TaxID=3026147 RepID=UPI0030BCCC45
MPQSTKSWYQVIAKLLFLAVASIQLASTAAEAQSPTSTGIFAFDVQRGDTGGVIGTLNTVGDDLCPTAAVNGCDFSRADDLVRTNDGVAYEFAVSVDPNGDEIAIRAVLEPGLVWDQLPGTCLSGTSAITGSGTLADPSTVSCDLGLRGNNGGFSSVITFVAGAMSDALNGTTSGLASAELSATTLGAPLVDDISDVDDVEITAKPHYNLRKEVRNAAPATYSGVSGYSINYFFFVETLRANTNGNASDDPDPYFGNEIVVGDISFLEDASSVSPNAIVTACSNIQVGQTLLPVFSPANAESSVINAGTVSCTGLDTNNAAVTITGADLSLSHFPTETSNGTAISADNRIASFGQLTVFFPLTDISAAGGSLGTVNVLENFSPTSASGQANFNGAPQDANGGENDADNTVAFTVEEGSGLFNHFYRCAAPFGDQGDCSAPTDPPTTATSRGSGDGPVLPGEVFSTQTSFTNNSFSSIANGSVCAVFDSRYYAPFADANTGSDPARCTNCGGETEGVDYFVEYGVGYISTAFLDASPTPNSAIPAECTAATGWFGTLSDAEAAGAVTKVRLRKVNPLESGDSAVLQVQLRAYEASALTGVDIGTLFKTWGTFSSDLGSRNCRYVPGEWDTINHNRRACGDRLFFTNALARIDKQTLPSDSVNTVDAGQQISYALNPTFTAPGAIQDTVTIVDQLPAGVTYIEGTSVQGSTNLAPTVTGTSVTGQILTWDLGTLTTNVPIESISFDIDVPLTTANNTQLDNVARIDAAIDASSAEQRSDLRRVTVNSPDAMLITKRVAQDSIDPEESIDYTLEYFNATQNPFNEIDIIDVLPFVGDGRGSNFTGDIAYTSATPQSTSAVMYFTKDGSSAVDGDPTDASNSLTTGSTNWCQGTAGFAVNPTATPAAGGSSSLCPADGTEVTAIRLIDTEQLGVLGLRSIDFRIATTGNEGGDIYRNAARGIADTLSLPASTPVVQTVVNETPVIMAAKENADVTGNVVTFNYRIENPTADFPLTNVQLTDNLDSLFGAGNYGIETAPTLQTADVSGGVSVNPDFSGTGAETGLIEPTSTLAPGEFAIVQVAVRVTTVTDQGFGTGNYQNNATAAGTSFGDMVSDLSNNGVDPDENDDGDGSDADENTPTPVVLDADAPSINVIMTGDTSGFNSPNEPGDTVNYTITVQNTGDVALTSVSFFDASLTNADGATLMLTEAVDFVISSGGSAEGTLQPRETARYTASYDVTFADIVSQEIEHTISARGTAPDGVTQVSDVSDDTDDSEDVDPDNDGNPDDPVTTPLLGAPGINVVMTGDTSAFNTPNEAGDTIDYTIIVENTGAVPLTTVTLVDQTLDNADGVTLMLTEDVDFAISSSGSAEGTLQPRETARYTASYDVTFADIVSQEIEHTISARGTAPDGVTQVSDVSDDTDDSEDVDPDNDGNPDDPVTTPLLGAPGINVVMTGDTDDFANPVQAGDTIRYAIAVENTGALPLSNITFFDQILENADGTALMLTQAPDFVPADGGSPEGTLNAGETATYQASYEVTLDDILSEEIEHTISARGTAPDGTTQVADISDDSDDTENVDLNADSNPDDPVTTQLAATPAIEVTKASDTNGLTTPPLPTQEIVYIITVQNIGNLPLSGVALTDTLTNDDSNVSDLSGDVAYLRSNGPSSEGTLQPLETATYTLTYAITAGDIDSGAVDNSVLAMGTDTRNVEVSDISDDPNSPISTTDDPTRTAFTQEPGIDIVQTGDAVAISDPTVVGEVIVYDITVQNTGNVTLTDVTLTNIVTNAAGGSSDISADIEFQGADQGSSEGTLEFGETATYQVTYAVSQPDIDSGEVINVSTVVGLAPDGASVTEISDDLDDLTNVDPDGNGNPDDPTITPLFVAPQVTLVLAADEVQDTNGSGIFGDAGDTANYVFTAENTGNTALADVVISDTGLPGGILSPAPAFDGDLAIAEGPVAVASMSYVITPTDVATGELQASATVTSTAVASLLDGSPDPDTALIGLDPVTDLSDTGSDPDIGDAGSLQDVGTPGTTDSDGVAGNDADEPTVVLLPEQMPTITLINSIIDFADTNGDLVVGTAGDVITYEYRAINTGNVALANLTVSDPLTDTDLAPMVPQGLLPGEEAAFTAEYVVDDDDVAVLRVVSSATVSGTAVATTLSAAGVPEPDTDAPLLSGVGVSFGPISDISDTGTEPAPDAEGRVVIVPDPAGTDTNGIAGDDRDEPTEVLLPFLASNLSLSGTVFLDNGDGVLGAQDDRSAGDGYVVQLINGDGSVVDETIADGSGFYEFAGFPSGEYSVLFLTPERVGVGMSAPVIIDASNADVTDVNQPIDPQGTVYNSATGDPVAGVTLEMVDGTGSAFPTACFLSGQQPQTTAADGFYAFDVVPGGDAAACPAAGETTYQISIVAVPADFLLEVSSVIPAQDGALQGTTCTAPNGANRDAVPGGSCQLSASDQPPNPLAATPYFLSFALEAGDPDVVNNHIPIDPVSTTLSPSDLDIFVTKVVRGGRDAFLVGEVVPYEITIQNNGTDSVAPVLVRDQLPAGLVYLPGSGRVDGVSVEPDVAGQSLTFTNINLVSGATLSVTLSARMTGDTGYGDLVNTADVRDPTNEAVISNTGTATVRRTLEAVFDCSDVIGKVFDDRNMDGHQGAFGRLPSNTLSSRGPITAFDGALDKLSDTIVEQDPFGEPGLPNVRLLTPTGTIITTDEFGRFSVPCAELPAAIGSNFALKLDERSLPTGYRVTTENPLVMRLTRGIFAEMNFGAALGRVVDIDLTNAAFVGGSAQPVEQLSQGIDGLLRQIVNTPSVIRLSYFANGESQQTTQARLDAVEALIRGQWADGGQYRLIIERTTKQMQ